MDALETLQTRLSTSTLGDPAPSDEQLRAVLKAAEHAPDHGLMRPWRFFVVRGEARSRLGEVMAEALQSREPEATAELLERERQKPLRAPLLVIVAARPRERRGVPQIEQVLAAAAAAENVMLAAHALGVGAYWRTGDPAYDPRVKAALGLDPSDSIIGFLYLGTPGAQQPTRRARPESEAFEWSAPGEWSKLPTG